jgi:hypothetical protein
LTLPAQNFQYADHLSKVALDLVRAAILVQLYLNDYIEQLMRLRYHFADFGWSKVDGLDVVACKCAFVCLVRLIQHIASPAADFDPLRNPLH